MENESAGTRKRRRWPKVVGIVLLVVAIGAGVTIAIILRQIATGKRGFQSLIRDMVARCEEESLLAKGQLVVLQDLSNVANRRDTSVFGVLLCAGVAADALADEKISEQEFADMTLVRDFAREEEGGLGFANCGRFFQENPRIQKMFESMKERKRGWFEMQKWRR